MLMHSFDEEHTVGLGRLAEDSEEEEGMNGKKVNGGPYSGSHMLMKSEEQ